MKANGMLQLRDAPSIRRAALAKYLGDRFHLSHRQVDTFLEQTECGLSQRPFATRKTRIVVIARGHGHYLLACPDAQPTHAAAVVSPTDHRLLEFWSRLVQEWEKVHDHHHNGNGHAALALFDPSPTRIARRSAAGRRKHKKVRLSRRQRRRFAPRCLRR